MNLLARHSWVSFCFGGLCLAACYGQSATQPETALGAGEPHSAMPSPAAPRSSSESTEASRAVPPDELHLAKRYAFGEGAVPDPMKAVAWLTKASDRGDVEAALALGRLYREGRGVARDLDRARHFYARAAERGVADALFELGMLDDGTPPTAQPERALEAYRRAAEAGHGGAAVNLGLLYEQGRGTPRDYAKAVYWYGRAADLGSAAGQFHLGRAYATGRGVEKDERQAIEWFQSAALQGHPEAQDRMGALYEAGLGVPRDLERARDLYEQAAEAGFAPAQVHLGTLYENGSGVDKDPVLACQWYERAANQQHPAGLFHFGLCLHHGWGKPKDPTAACSMFLRAAQSGHAAAQNNIAVCLEHGHGIHKDEEQAVYWYRQAADRGDALALHNLASMYLNGKGVAPDYDEAERLLVRAAQLGRKQAEATLEALRERRRCEKTASTELFGVKLACATRAQLRGALARSGAPVEREDDAEWFDAYDSSRLLAGSRRLELGYTEDDRLGKATYTFPSEDDREQVLRIADLVARKYGAARQRVGSATSGTVRFEWQTRDGVRIVVRRGWPDTTTSLEYQVPRYAAQIDRALRAERAVEQRQDFDPQSNAF